MPVTEPGGEEGCGKMERKAMAMDCAADRTLTTADVRENPKGNKEIWESREMS